MAVLGWLVVLLFSAWITGAALASSWWELHTKGKLNAPCCFLLVLAAAAICATIKLCPFAITLAS